MGLTQSQKTPWEMRIAHGLICLLLTPTLSNVGLYVIISNTSQSKSCITHMKRQLQTMCHDACSCIEYLQLAKSWADPLAAMGKPVDEEDIISFTISEPLLQCLHQHLQPYYMRDTIALCCLWKWTTQS